MTKAIKVLIPIVLVLGIIYLIIIIFRIDIRYFTYNKNNCVNQILTQLSPDWSQIYKNKPYNNIDCRTVSNDFNMSFADKAKSSDVSLSGLGFGINSERDYCEYTHQVEQKINTIISKGCYRPSFFKQQ